MRNIAIPKRTYSWSASTFMERFLRALYTNLAHTILTMIRSHPLSYGDTQPDLSSPKMNEYVSVIGRFLYSHNVIVI